MSLPLNNWFNCDFISDLFESHDFICTTARVLNMISFLMMIHSDFCHFHRRSPYFYGSKTGNPTACSTAKRGRKLPTIAFSTTA